MPKTLKFVIKGELPGKSNVFVMSDGEEVVVKKTVRSVVPSKKNQQRVMVRAQKTADGKEYHKGFLVPSAQYVAWHKANMPLFNEFSNIAARKGISLPIVRAKIKVLFYFSDSIDKDLHNKFETIADMLEECGLIANDSFKVLKPITLDGWVNRAHPRTEIYLSILNPQDHPQEYNWDITPSDYKRNLQQRRNSIRRLKRKAVSER